MKMAKMQNTWCSSKENDVSLVLEIKKVGRGLL